MANDHPTETQVADAASKLQTLRHALQQVLFGQETLIELAIVGLLARGHLLFEGLPGLGKTELVKALGKAISLDVKRIQFTPDLLPGDITGNPILQDVEGRRQFVFQRGPLFANLVLADEINRASPKTQSALLEAMQERRVTVTGETHILPDPFFVVATQNPIELEGTYPLPEAQLDRFLFKLEVHSTRVDVLEQIVLHRELGADVEVPRVMDTSELLALMETARRIYLPPVVAGYIARLVDATQPGRPHSAGVKYGASPRAAISLAAGAKARALLGGRLNASFEDVRALAPAVLCHRILTDYAARLEGRTTSSIVSRLLEKTPADATVAPDVVKLAAAKI